MIVWNIISYNSVVFFVMIIFFEQWMSPGAKCAVLSFCKYGHISFYEWREKLIYVRKKKCVSTVTIWQLHTYIINYKLFQFNEKKKQIISFLQLVVNHLFFQPISPKWILQYVRPAFEIPMIEFDVMVSKGAFRNPVLGFPRQTWYTIHRNLISLHVRRWKPTIHD